MVAGGTNAVAGDDGDAGAVKSRAAALAPVVALLAVTAWALAAFVDVALEERPGVRMDLPEKLGDWTGHQLRFCHNPQCKREYRTTDLPSPDSPCPACGGELHTMSVEEFEQLPRDTEFRKAIYQNPVGEMLQVSIVLSGRERESIHRPERCLIGQGFHLSSGGIVHVPVPGHTDLSVFVWLTERKIETPIESWEHTGFYAYWFVGQGRETPRHLMRMFWLAWDRVVHSVAHRWAYIAVAGRRTAGSDSYLDQLREFLPALHQWLVLPPNGTDADASAATRNPTSASM